jgi:diacylglycerol kinase
MKPTKQNLLLAFKNAFAGLALFFKNEKNGKIQVCISVIVVIAGLFFKISTSEWIAIIGCIALVLSLEMINSAIEKLANMVEPNYNLTIKAIKDISAGAVLWSALISIIIGALIFIPKLKILFIETFH